MILITGCKRDINLRISGLYDYCVPGDRIRAMENGEVLVLGRPSLDFKPDIQLVVSHEGVLKDGGGGRLDRRISSIQCLIVLRNNRVHVYDCSR